MSDADAPRRAGGDDDAASRRGAAVVRDRLAQLPDAVAETLRLTYFSRLDNHEIALRTGMTDREVRTALSAGLRQLGKLLQGV